MERVLALINRVSPMSPENLALLGPGLPITLKKNANILEQGAVCKCVYFVSKGFFRMFYVDHEGNQINNRFTGPDNFLVDYQSFLTQQPSNYYWQAMEDAEVLAFDFNTIQGLYAASPDWERFGRLIAETVYLQLNERVELLQFMTPEQRYQHICAKRPELLNQISQYHLSSYLGIKPESLSRLRKRLLSR